MKGPGCPVAPPAHAPGPIWPVQGNDTQMLRVHSVESYCSLDPFYRWKYQTGVGRLTGGCRLRSCRKSPEAGKEKKGQGDHYPAAPEFSR